VAIPNEVRIQAEEALSEFCTAHSSEPGADRLRYGYKFETSAAVLFAERPSFMNRDEWVPRPIARFRYSQARNEWSLYWSDENNKWQRVSGVKAANDIRVLLETVLKDPLGVFWS